MKRIQLIFCFVFALGACGWLDKGDEEAVEDTFAPEDSILCNLDTTLASGNTIQLNYDLSKDILNLHVSTANWDTVYDVNKELAKDNSSINPLNKQTILWSTPEFAGLRQGCGSPCYYEVVIPFISGERPRRYFFPYTNNDPGIELSKNLIAFNSDHSTPQGYPVIKIKNLFTGETDSLPVEDSWEGRVSMNEFVDTIYATNQYFFIGQLDSAGNLISENSGTINLGVSDSCNWAIGILDRWIIDREFLWPRRETTTENYLAAGDVFKALDYLEQTTGIKTEIRISLGTLGVSLIDGSPYEREREVWLNWFENNPQ